MTTVEELLAAYRPPERAVTVTLDGPAMARMEQLRRELVVAQAMDLQARSADEELSPAIRAQLDEAEAAAVASARTFVVRGLGAMAYRELVDAHPKAGWRWHPVTFPPALLAAACVEPALTVAQATEIFTDWTVEAAGALFAAAVEVCEGAPAADRAMTEHALATMLLEAEAAAG